MSCACFLLPLVDRGVGVVLCGFVTVTVVVLVVAVFVVVIIIAVVIVIVVEA